MYIIVSISKTTSCVPSLPPRSAPDIVSSSPILYAVPPLVTVTDSIVPEPLITKVNSAPVALVPDIDFCVIPVNVWDAVYAALVWVLTETVEIIP